MLKWLSLAGVVVVLDQLVKAWVVAVLAVGERVPVGPVLSWVRWHNEGAAFSMLSDASGWQRWFFIALAVAFVVFIVYELLRDNLYHVYARADRTRPRTRTLQSPSPC